ncbi:MAG: diguanylate cyclase, partial [Rhizobacter sp.]|nr:diguanylate cyclase [Rhizobacter sp.]
MLPVAASSASGTVIAGFNVLPMHQRQKKLLDAICMVTLAVFFAVIAALSWAGRARELDSAARDATTAVEALELYAGGFVASADLSLLAADEALRAGAAHAPLNREQGNLILAKTVPRLGVSAFLRVFDRHGRSAYSSDGNAGDAGVTDRDYFQYHLEHPDGGLFISNPLMSRATGLASAVFSRRRVAASGEFDGVIVLGVPIQLFESALHRFDPGPDGIVLLVSQTGQPYAQNPPLPPQDALPVSDPDVVAALKQSLATGANDVVRTPLDADAGGHSRLVASRRVGQTSLVVMVGKSIDAALAEWRRQTAVLLPVATLLGLGAALMFTAITRSLVAAGERS